MNVHYTLDAASQASGCGDAQWCSTPSGVHASSCVAGLPHAEAMQISKFDFILTCACGRETAYQSMLSKPGGLAPIPCVCGRRFVLKQLDPREVTSIVVDPTGATGGAVPEGLPELH